MDTISHYFLIFFIFSVMGWIMEAVATAISYKKFTNRGFLIGPYCPIYGFGGLIMTLCLSQYHKDIVVLFCMSMILCSLLEYLTSWIMEKLFHARWWDYSHRRFNIEGRVCLANSVLFGLMGVFVVRFISPILTNFLNLIPSKSLVLIAFVCFFLLVIDICLSFFIINRLKQTISKMVKEDSTAEITSKVKEILKNQTILLKRLLLAFPNMEFLPFKKIKNKMIKKSE